MASAYHDRSETTDSHETNKVPKTIPASAPGVRSRAEIREMTCSLSGGMLFFRVALACGIFGCWKAFFVESFCEMLQEPRNMD